MTTKIAITSQDKETVSGHVGMCNHFFLYEVDEEGKVQKKSLELADNQILRYSFHEDPSPNPQNPLFEVDFLFAKGMGQGAVNNLAARNVKAYSIEEENPDIAIQKLIEGTLEAFSEEGSHGGGCNCGGHHH
jgi:predicted Fe-Mo cluster-binding NifX family protein